MSQKVSAQRTPHLVRLIALGLYAKANKAFASTHGHCRRISQRRGRSQPLFAIMDQEWSSPVSPAMTLLVLSFQALWEGLVIRE